MNPPKDLFSSTAQYYSAYRPSYPQRLISELRERTVGEHGERLIDWGAGTGELTLPLAPFFDRVTAIDADPEMIDVAKAKAEREGVDNVEWRVGPAEELEVEPESCSLIVAGSAFHWMDRELLSKRAFEGLKPGRALALVGGGSSVWEGTAEWHQPAVECLRKYLGDERRAGSGKYEVTKKHGDFLGPAGFRIENVDYPTDHSWTIDEIIGYLYSTSFAGPHVLGDKRESFERDLREALARANSSGLFYEKLDFYAIIAYKPGS